MIVTETVLRVWLTKCLCGDLNGRTPFLYHLFLSMLPVPAWRPVWTCTCVARITYARVYVVSAYVSM